MKPLQAPKRLLAAISLLLQANLFIHSQSCTITTNKDTLLECGSKDTLRTKVNPFHEVKNVYNGYLGLPSNVDAIDSSFVYFASDTKVYFSIDLGKSWSAKSYTNLNISKDFSLRWCTGAKFISKNIIYLVVDDFNSDSSYLVKSIDGGVNWKRMFAYNFMDHGFIKFVFYKDKLKWLLMDNGCFIYDEMSNSFQFSEIVKGISNYDITFLQFNSPTEVFAGIKDKGLFKSTNGGINWTLFEMGSEISFYHIFSDGIGYKIKDRYLYKTKDNGKSWYQKISGLDAGKFFLDTTDRNKLILLRLSRNLFVIYSTIDAFESYNWNYFYDASKDYTDNSKLIFSGRFILFLKDSNNPDVYYYDTRLTYEWKDPQGNIVGNEPELKIQPLSSGNYTVKITAPTGCVATDAVRVNVNPLQLSVPAAISLGCGGKAALSVSSNYMGSGSVAYTWSPTTGLDNPQSATPNASVSVDTDYKVDALSTEGCTASSSVPVKVVPVVANAGNDVDIVCGDTLALMANHNLGVAENIIYQWKNMAGDVLSNKEVHTVNPATLTSYIVSVDAGNNCKDIDTIQVGITPLTASIITPTKLECGDSIRLDMSHNSNNNAGTYLWLPNAGLSDRTAKRPLCSFTATTNVQLEFTKPNGCKAMAEKTLQVYPIYASVPGKSISCGQTAYFNPTIQYNGKYPLTYKWEPAEAVSNAGILNPAVSAAQSTTFTFSLSSSNGCKTVIDDILLLVQQRDFGLSFSQNQQVFTKPPFEVLFLNTTPDKSLYDFTWYYGDGSSYAGTNPPKYEYKQNGLYDVALHAIEKTTGCANQLVKPEWILCDGGVVCGHKAEITFSCGNG